MPSNIAAFAWTSFVIELTPGPNMTYLAVLTLAEGRRAGLAAVAGVALGLAIIGSLAALGVGAIVQSSPMLYETLRIAGVAYLLWLAAETWRGEDVTPDVDASDDGQAAMRRAFTNGLVTNVLNPKAAMFYIAVLPVFLDPSRPTTAQAFTLSAIYVAIATTIHLVIVLLAARARPVIVAGGRSVVVRRVLALMLAGVAVWMGVATRR
ncbi:MAG: LysE family translocator [Hyphomicrobium aestuarii]|nr:LysE family translocator [Hyphomicrobium aestuarii]